MSFNWGNIVRIGKNKSVVKGGSTGGGFDGGGGSGLITLLCIVAIFSIKSFLLPTTHTNNLSETVHSSITPTEININTYKRIQQDPPYTYTESFPKAEPEIVKPSIDAKIPPIRKSKNTKLAIEVFFNKFKMIEEMCFVKTDLCIHDNEAEFTVKCGNDEVTFSTDEIITIRGRVGDQTKEYTFKDVEQVQPRDSIPEILLLSGDTLSPIQFVKAIEYSKLNQATSQCHSEISICFSKKQGYGKLSISCYNLNLSTNSKGSLSLAGKSKNGDIVEFDIFNGD